MSPGLLDDVALQGPRAAGFLTAYCGLERGGCGDVCMQVPYIWVVVLVIGHFLCFGYDYGDGKDGC